MGKLTKAAEECRKCGRPVEITDGYPVHRGGGACWQKCTNCFWHGSKMGSYTHCPECGNATLLIDHCVILMEEPL